MDPSRVLGLLLIAIGVMTLVAFTTDIGGEIVVPTIGVAFLAFYLSTRNYGLLIPGGILTGLGTGIVVASRGGPEASVLLGLGGGFLSIAVIDVIMGDGTGAWWWPLIPGGILTVIGASAVAGVEDAGAYVLPLALIVLGVALVVRRRPSGSGDDAAG